MFHNILVCIDGSSHSDRALTEAIDLADAQNARLTLLTSVASPPYWASTPMTAAGIEPLAAECAQPAQEALSAAVDRVPASIPLTKVLSQEPIRDALTEQLQTGRHDLLVMGSRGRRALSASLLGSVSHYALNHSPIPVLVIHAEATEEHDAGDEAALTPAAAAPPTQT